MKSLSGAAKFTSAARTSGGAAASASRAARLASRSSNTTPPLGSPCAYRSVDSAPGSGIGAGQDLADLLVLPADGVYEMAPADGGTVSRREVRGTQGGIADVAAREAELSGLGEVDIRGERHLGGQAGAPDLLALRHPGEREVDDDVQPPGERVVEVVAQVRGQDGEPVVLL